MSIYYGDESPEIVFELDGMEFTRGEMGMMGIAYTWKHFLTGYRRNMSIERLEGKGLVQPASNHSLGNYYTLTDRGRQVLKQMEVLILLVGKDSFREQFGLVLIENYEGR